MHPIIYRRAMFIFNLQAGHKVILHKLPDWRSDWNYDSRGIACKRTQCSSATRITSSAIMSCVLSLFLISTII